MQKSLAELRGIYGAYLDGNAVSQLQKSAGPFASMVAKFCHRLGWFDFEELITRLQVLFLRHENAGTLGPHGHYEA